MTSPDELADVERVPQDTVAALRSAADCRVVPGRAARPRDALRIQLPGDRTRAVTGAVRLEDPPDDGSGDGVEFAQAAFRLAVGTKAADHPIPIGRSAEAPPQTDTVLLPTPGIPADFDQRLGVEDALHAELERVDLAFGDRVHLYAQVARLLVEGSHMLQVAREAVLAPGEHNVDLAGPHGGQQSLVAGPQRGGAGDRGVGEGPDDGPALPLRIGGAVTDLVFD